MKKAPIVDSLKNDDPESLREIEKLLSDKTNFQIMKFLYREQKGLPAFIGIEVIKNEKRIRIYYQPIPIEFNRLTFSYISKRLKIKEIELKERLEKFLSCVFTNQYMGKDGKYRYALTGFGIKYFKEVYCHILT